ncbi:ATP-binding cassette domain-containing protein [Pengzhenrongella sicca]|uniref:ATP-binding cassette domain-containing protein n=1 Tax=Pengzhenrongella sicca TaxID=2819238 RepID=A0A8A4ZLV6_9MICO|nr:ATP-binding cassette domain-containing protein [Pengzhenrongella sicca]
MQGLDLHVEAGERVLLLGPSGAGKSTFLQAVAGVLDDGSGGSESGRLLVDGAPAAGQRGRVGLMQQDPESQIVLARIGDDVAFGAENLAVPRAQIWTRVAESLAAVGLDLPHGHPTSALSGGQKQRLGLAGILAMRPGALILDEPTANLDPRGVLEVRDAVVRVLGATGSTLIVVEHRVEVWVDVVDRIVVLGRGGAVVADGAPARVLAGQRSTLDAAGVWVPGRAPQVTARGLPACGAAAVAPVTLLAARDLAVARVPGRRRRPSPPVAAGIGLSVAAGEALVVTGPNGAGKSTLALTLAGLLPAAGGSVVAGAPLRSGGVGADPADWTAAELITRIAMVFQEPEHQFVTGTVRDEIAFGPRRVAARGRRRSPRLREAGAGRVDELLERLRLTDLAGANPFTLSGGEKRRVSVATALATSPAVLVLDEPTFGQDATTWAELAGLFGELLDAGSAIVAVSHDAEIAGVLGAARLELGGAARTPRRAPARSGRAA